MSESTPEINPDNKVKRIRSFVLRQGRATEGQRLALERHWPKFGLSLDDDKEIIFADSTKNLVLEIGFGNGHSLAQMAEENPDNNYIGIEVHRPGVGSLLMEINRLQLDNVRCFHDDAIDVLNKKIVDNSLDRVQLFFPDPWQKRRHHKRRIVQQPFLKLIAQKLKPGGVFHMATDWQDYANEAMKTLSAAPDFNNVQADKNFSPRPKQRPLTKFENRGQKLGHGVWDLIFERL